ncbi:MAG: cell division protein FtsB [Rubrivivax sp.]|jgi:cell division protein FtsB
MRLVTVALVCLIGLTQASLWFGRGSVPHVVSMERQLAAQQAVNREAQARNERLTAEVNDLRDGLEMVEETARRELGMVKPDEVLVQVTARR